MYDMQERSGVLRCRHVSHNAVGVLQSDVLVIVWARVNIVDFNLPYFSESGEEEW